MQLWVKKTLVGGFCSLSVFVLDKSFREGGHSGHWGRLRGIRIFTISKFTFVSEEGWCALMDYIPLWLHFVQVDFIIHTGTLKSQQVS